MLTVIARTTNHKYILPCANWVDAVDYIVIVSCFFLLVCMYTREKRCLPACETDNPANSISWSRDHPPISMRSLSSAAASLEEIAWFVSTEDFVYY